jgi:hypothetical protein
MGAGTFRAYARGSRAVDTGNEGVRYMKQAMIDYTQKKKFDVFFTPEYAVQPLLPFICPNWVVWEPTDVNHNSGITKTIRRRGNSVISTNKQQRDFLRDCRPEGVDCIVTNPPYSLKDQFLMRAFDLRLPFAFLLPLTALEGVQRGALFREHGIEVLVLDRRVEFTGKSVWFATAWFCHGILPECLMFAQLEKGK